MLQPRFLLIGLLGFFSGLPLALTASTLTAWLFEAGVDRASIGLFAAIATPYALKFLWAPLLDGLRLPYLTVRLGRRRSWLLFTQLLLAAAIAMMGLTDPAITPWLTALAGFMVTTLAATQDTIIDAYRVERLAPEEQGMGAAWATFGYRIAMLVSGAGALVLSSKNAVLDMVVFYIPLPDFGWQGTYLIMATLMGVGCLVTMLMHEPAVKKPRQTHGGVLPFLREYVVEPFRDFMTRPLWLQVLVFVILYKLGDAFMGAMFNPFLLDIGFTKMEIAKVVKLYGLIATILGAFAGGWLVARIGMYRSLMLCGFGHMFTNLLLVELARRGTDIPFLTLAVSTENFTGGMATAAFVAYLSALCKLNYTATQYALLSSLASFGRTWLSTPSGALSQAVGWEVFFAIASLMAVPGLVLLWWIERRKNRES